MTLHISEASPHLVEADAIVIGVTSDADGAHPVPGTEEVDEALGGTLAATLATLGLYPRRTRRCWARIRQMATRRTAFAFAVRHDG